MQQQGLQLVGVQVEKAQDGLLSPTEIALFECRVRMALMSLCLTVYSTL